MNDNILYHARIAADRRRHDRQVFRRPTTEAICGDFIWNRIVVDALPIISPPSLPAGIPGALPARPAQIGQGIPMGTNSSLTLHGFAAE